MAVFTEKWTKERTDVAVCFLFGDNNKNLLGAKIDGGFAFN